MTRVRVGDPFATEMAAVVLRHTAKTAGLLQASAQPSILASRHVDRLQKLDAKDLEAEYEVDMLMLDGVRAEKCSFQ